ncbi:acyl-CoA dehydrogenase family protein [Catalinimonas niigatensis]|uniref:acyl-CoA dehydrogenase family protein n=1 Tax=Catalinimonas niigatensis TaxID=1397264 RepID=UPI0026661EFF|nr:acyl-CoA dehydrogenase family protein [Catalinimonas niigatensis]WPP53019.1 acyl-CoA dehydrogenase family protein [Catalinimonas niigatensis]
MNFLKHPTDILSADVIEEIRGQSARAEQEKKLTQQQLQLIYEQQWLRLFIPQRYKGLEMNLPEALQILEALAYADGSLGWTVNLGAGANLFAAYIQSALSEQIFTDPKACIAGSGALSGIARQEKDGYTISGSWKYGSGSSHATAFTANCKLKTDGTSNTPEFYSFVFLPNEVEVKDTWRSYGLQATSSHDFEVNHVHVPEERIFNLLKPSPYERGPLYRFPFMQFAEVTTCLQLTGMACHFLDEVKALLFHKKGMQGDALKDHPKVQDTLAQAEAQLEAARSWLYMLVQEGWKACEESKAIPEEVLRKISLSAKHAAKVTRESAEMMYPLCGMTVLQADTELNRAWRDLHTASQHILLSPLGFAEVGKF